jgi:hypothetical protein
MFFVFYFISLLSYFEKKQSRLMRSRCCPCVCVCVSPLSLLGNGSVKVPLSLLGNGYVFYAVRVVSKESSRLLLARTSCILIQSNSFALVSF